MSAAGDDGHATLLAAARLYYEDDLSQQQIAERLGVSRSTVSRLLGLAREQGIVQIEIRPPSSSSQLASWLQGALRLRRAVVVPPPPRASGPAILAAPALAELERLALRAGDVLAVSGGAALWELARARSAPALRGVQVVPAAGGDDAAQWPAGEVARRLALAGGGEPRPLHAPARPSAALAAALRADAAVAARLALWDGLAAALVGIEPGDDGGAAVGAIAGRGFDLAGAPAGADAAIALDRAQLRGAGSVIAVAAGDDAPAAIVGAARAGLVDVLVTDAPTASAALDVIAAAA